MANFTPEKSKQIALARLDLIHKWLEFRKNLKINYKQIMILLNCITLLILFCLAFYGKYFEEVYTAGFQC